MCHDGDIRLVNGSQPYEGRVEVCFNETWGTICGYINPWRWNTLQADVVCQQLGYSRAGNFISFMHAVSCTSVPILQRHPLLALEEAVYLYSLIMFPVEDMNQI